MIGEEKIRSVNAQVLYIGLACTGEGRRGRECARFGGSQCDLVRLG